MENHLRVGDQVLAVFLAEPKVILAKVTLDGRELVGEVGLGFSERIEYLKNSLLSFFSLNKFNEVGKLYLNKFS